VDIYDKGDTIVIQSTVAGVKPEDLDVSITNDSVTIRGRRERHEEITEDRYYYKELFWGVFSRSVILPEEIDEDAAEASLKHGLLTLRLPKKRRGVVQKLKVKVS
jgi:HSP20 family protein